MSDEGDNGFHKMGEERERVRIQWLMIDEIINKKQSRQKRRVDKWERRSNP